MRDPLIGITVHVQSARANEMILLLGAVNVEAVRLAGGVPVLIPLLPQGQGGKMLDRVQGLLVTGGGRLARRLVKMHELPSLEEISPLRYAFERELIADAVRRDMPVLGICRGMQTIAATLGGRVANLSGGAGARTIQHYQRQPGWRPTHDVEIQSSSRLSAIINDKMAKVNSFHRQTVAEPGNELTVSAWAEDGVVEALESPAHRFLVGVQFHPERLLSRHARWLKLFEAFINAARNDT